MTIRNSPLLPGKANTYAIVVSFHPDVNLYERIELISRQVKKVLIIDNGSSKEELERLRVISLNSLNVDLITNEENLGISRALNIGVSIAINEGIDWLITLDQDSCVSKDMMHRMSLTYEKCSDHEQVAAVIPTYHLLSEQGTKSEVVTHDGEGDEQFKYVKLAATSGTLLKTKIFSVVGTYDNDLFVDYVDFEFCIRLHIFKYFIVQSEAILYHEVGFPVIHNFLGLKLVVKNHSKERKYYIAKNRLITYKKVLRLDRFIIRWIAIDFIKIFIYFLTIIVFESEKKEKVSYYIKGIYDGLTFSIANQKT